eukprot:2703689-Lingulodinium_polyedra.AAC.1
MTKCMRTGEITLDDYGQQLEVVRQSGSGLFVVRIDHLLREHFQDESDLRFLIDPGVTIGNQERSDG